MASSWSFKKIFWLHTSCVIIAMIRPFSLVERMYSKKFNFTEVLTECVLYAGTWVKHFIYIVTFNLQDKFEGVV